MEYVGDSRALVNQAPSGLAPCGLRSSPRSSAVASGQHDRRYDKRQRRQTTVQWLVRLLGSNEPVRRRLPLLFSSTLESNRRRSLTVSNTRGCVLVSTALRRRGLQPLCGLSNVLARAAGVGHGLDKSCNIGTSRTFSVKDLSGVLDFQSPQKRG